MIIKAQSIQICYYYNNYFKIVTNRVLLIVNVEAPFFIDLKLNDENYLIATYQL